MLATDTRATLDRLDTDGYVVLERAVGDDTLGRIKDELRPWLGDGAHRGRNDFEGDSTNRVYALLAKAPSVARLVEHPWSCWRCSTRCCPPQLPAVRQPGHQSVAWGDGPVSAFRRLLLPAAPAPAGPRRQRHLGHRRLHGGERGHRGAARQSPLGCWEKPSDDDPRNCSGSRCRPDRCSCSWGRCGTVAAPIGRTGRAWPSPPSTARRGCASRSPR